MKNTFSLKTNVIHINERGLIFPKEFADISNVSEIALKKLFTIIKHQFSWNMKMEIDSKKSNLIYCNIRFFLKHFLIYHIYHNNGLNKLFTIIKLQF